MLKKLCVLKKNFDEKINRNNQYKIALLDNFLSLFLGHFLFLVRIIIELEYYCKIQNIIQREEHHQILFFTYLVSSN